MKNKHLLFSLSLAFAIGVILLLSLFSKNIIFEDIARVITIPFMLFTFASCAYSVVEEIIEKSRTEVKIESERINCWNYYIDNLTFQLGLVNKYDTPKNSTELEMNQSIEKREQELIDAIKTRKSYAINSLANGKVIDCCQGCMLLKVIYIITLSLLIISMMIAPLLLPYCEIIPTKTLTLSSLLWAIIEILLKDAIASKIYKRLYNKYHDKIEHEVETTT